jgi:hypothetical protein
MSKAAGFVVIGFPLTALLLVQQRQINEESFRFGQISRNDGYRSEMTNSLAIYIRFAYLDILLTIDPTKSRTLSRPKKFFTISGRVIYKRKEINPFLFLAIPASLRYTCICFVVFPAGLKSNALNVF